MLFSNQLSSLKIRDDVGPTESSSWQSYFHIGRQLGERKVIQLASEPFSEELVNAAWIRSKGLCECMDLARCRHVTVPHWRQLSWADRGKDSSLKGWEAHHVDPSGEPELSNCRILCIECHKNTPSYGTGRDNPIVSGLLAFVDAGLDVVRIQPNWNAKPRPNAEFHLKDGSTRTVEVASDHATFMRFWKQAAQFKHLLSAAEFPPES